MNLCFGGIKILSGNANRELVSKICKELEIKMVTSEVNHFSDGEINVSISETVRRL